MKKNLLLIAALGLLAPLHAGKKSETTAASLQAGALERLHENGLQESFTAITDFLSRSGDETVLGHFLEVHTSLLTGKKDKKYAMHVAKFEEELLHSDLSSVQREQIKKFDQDAVAQQPGGMATWKKVAIGVGVPVGTIAIAWLMAYWRHAHNTTRRLGALKAARESVGRGDVEPARDVVKRVRGELNGTWLARGAFVFGGNAEVTQKLHTLN